MRFCLGDDILERFPTYCVGVVVVHDIDNVAPRPDIERLLAEAVDAARQRLASTPVRELPRVALWRDAFQRAGINPNRFPPSIEALLARVARGGEVNHVSPAVDVANALALRHALPMGCHDIDRLIADIEVRLSRAGDRFQLSDAEPLEEVPPGEPVYAEGCEIRTRRWVWRQSVGARVKPTTRHVLYPIDGFVGETDEAVRAAVAELAELAERALGAPRVSTAFLDRDNRAVDLGTAVLSETVRAIYGRTVHAIIPADEFARRIDAGEKLRIYQGIDPSSPVIHIGHAVGLRKLRQLQDLGHKIILLIGDFTGRIGDPTGKSAMRVPLTHEQVLENARTYTEQAAKILDFDHPDNPIEVRYNGEWWDNLTARDMIGLAGQFTVQQMQQRDMFQRRLAENKPIGLHEFLYPLIQGYDSVALNTDAELGGTDQTFNMLCGRTLMAALQGKSKIVISVKMLEGLDGRLMSKTNMNWIGLAEPPEDQFVKVMRIDDSMIARYFELATDVSDEELAEIQRGLADGSVNPAQLKRRLARIIVTMFHGAEAAERAEAAFGKRTASEENVTAITVAPGTYEVSRLLAEHGLTPSRGAAKRLIEGGGVEVDGVRVTDPNAAIEVASTRLIRAGRGRFLRLEVG